MFEKLKKFWSSSSNINSSRKSSPKPFRTKSTRNVSNIHFHELTRPSCCNEEERNKINVINRPPSGSSTADSVSLNRYNVHCTEDIHDMPTQEFIEDSHTPMQEDDRTLTPIISNGIPQRISSCSTFDNSYIALVQKDCQSTDNNVHDKGKFIVSKFQKKKF
uniref:Uncharacterized protein n=1 Tax=Parastrongyloides trichosuri TaxID=131310 RepID=A0A0N4ZR00_PARTI